MITAHTHKIYDKENWGGGETAAFLEKDLQATHWFSLYSKGCVCIIIIIKCNTTAAYAAIQYHMRQPWFTNFTTNIVKTHSVLNSYIHGLYDGEIRVPFILSSSEPWCHHSGYMNSQNYKSHSLTHKVPLHDLKGGTWCAECKWNYWAHFYY